MSRFRLLVRGLFGALLIASCDPSADDDSSFVPPPPPPTCMDTTSLAVELCNGMDDDCDGVVDEAPGGGPLQQGCDGGCGGGTQTCVAGAWGACDATTPAAEICNGVDDNCNDEVDEGCACVHGTTRSCGSDVGACRTGIEQCLQGNWLDTCHGEVTAMPTETCNNGIDDNCDGRIDEACQCATGETQVCGKDVGICQSGTLTCDAMGQWSASCEGAIEPQTETCNGLDDDCDGEVDRTIATGVGWQEDPYEGADTCGAATPLPTATDSAGWVSLNVADPADITTYPTVYPTGDEDWFRFRAQTVSHGACFPGASQCAFVLVVQLELSGTSDEGDYELCVATNDNCGSIGPNDMICSNAARWVESANSYVLGIKWAGTCGADDSRQVKVRVRNTDNAQSCSYYQVHAHFAYDENEPCP